MEKNKNMTQSENTTQFKNQVQSKMQRNTSSNTVAVCFKTTEYF